MSDRLKDLELFVRVAETGSFSRAGREAGLAQPTVSRMIGALETRLGVKLLTRTTRRVVLTDAGTALIERARSALAKVEEAENAARGADALSGTLRVATPVTFGAREIVPALGSFLAEHPGLRVSLLMADRRVDLVEEGVDLAIRLGPLGDSSFVSRRLASAPRLAVASPDYLARRGEPCSPSDLAAHDILSSQPSGSEVWTFRHPSSGETSVRLQARVAVTAVEGMLAAARAGLGVASVSLFACRDELATGELRRVVAGYDLAPIDVHAIMPGGRRPARKARVFLDSLAVFLAERAPPPSNAAA